MLSHRNYFCVQDTIHFILVIRTNKNITTSEYILLLIVLLSILLSSYLFVIEDNQKLGMFIGLWAPTIMGLINFINIKFKK